MDFGIAVVAPLMIFAFIDGVILTRSIQRLPKRSSVKEMTFVVFAAAVFIMQLGSAVWYAHELNLIHIDSAPLLYFLNGFSVVCMTATAYLWLRHLILEMPGNHSNSMIVEAILILPLVATVAMAVATPWTGWFIVVGDNLEVTNGSAYFMQIVCSYCYLLIAIAWVAAAAIKGKGAGMGRTLRTCILFITPSIIGSLMQVLILRGGYTQMGISIGMLFMYLDLYIEDIKRTEYLEGVAKLNQELQAANAELETRQVQLEQAAAKQEAHIKEITILNEELNNARKQAEAASAAKTDFLFSMSHDIRTPMNAIMGFRDLLEKHQEDPRRRADYLRKIEGSSTMLLSIINNVLEMARIEKGTVAIDDKAWSVDFLIDDISSIFADMMKQKGITFTTLTSIDHHYVYCDSIKVREVFTNILSNAYKYTNPGGKVQLHVEEISDTRAGYTQLRTTITDTGIGMSAEFLPHLYDEFSRESSTTETQIEGTGLGMPIVKNMIDLMNGTIEVSSEQGIGTTFIITLPHRIAEESAIEEFGRENVEKRTFIGKRILLVEDNELNAEIAEEILSDAGFIVERAEDGAVCINRIEEAPCDFYDAILMDIQMPNMNGYDATRAIRSLPNSEKANIPIVAMTANAFEEDKRDAMHAGMNGHVAKPINVTELMRTLASILC